MTSESASPIVKKKVSYSSGRVGFKGTLKYVYNTKKEKYIQDGNEMLQVQKELKMQEDKVRYTFIGLKSITFLPV